MAKDLEILKLRAEFLRVAAARRNAAEAGLVVQAATRCGANAAGVRIGITASRKVGNAVARNRAKRRLRAAAARVLPDRGRPGTDYVLIARASTVARPFVELVADLESALRRVDREARASPAQRRPPAGGDLAGRPRADLSRA
jgi:ribonuclease P protein component